jgi:hypothetical protein
MEEQTLNFYSTDNFHRPMLRKKEPMQKKGSVIRNICKKGYVLKEYNSARSFQRNAIQTKA